MLKERLNIPQISSGDLLRQAVREKTAMGLKAKGYMDRGALVPDDLVLDLITERLKQPDARDGYILDGFPRTVVQAEALELMPDGLGKADRVVAVIVPDEEIVKRISGRRTCSKCGAMYHVVFNPPRNVGLCNACNGELYQREDDAEDTVRMRLQVYAASTRPLVEYYDRKGLLAKVDGVGRPEEIVERIQKAVQLPESSADRAGGRE
jgi:adenylate kinase